MKLLLTLALVGITSACSLVSTDDSSHAGVETDGSVVTTVDDLYLEKRRKALGPNRRDATVVSIGSGRGGAALRTAERRHVLYYRYPYDPEDKTTGGDLDSSAAVGDETPSPAEALSSALAAMTKLDNEGADTPGAADKTISVEHGYSYYELSRWERYCEGKPDSLDITFIKKAGGHNKLPEHLVNDCAPKTIL